MKIAQVSPLIEAVPPRLYGGTERIVAYLSDALVEQGHDVTLFASADSRTKAKLVPCADGALRLDPAVKDVLPHHLIQMDRVRRMAREFDVLHFHSDLLHFPMVREFADRTVTTMHGRLDLPDLAPFFREFDDVPVVSISMDQRRALGPGVRWIGNVYHGLPTKLLMPPESPRRDYLAFLGRISPEKGPDRAIEIARRAGMKLRIAAKIDRNDEEYWRQAIEPIVRSSPHVEFVGEISEAEKPEFLGNARALLFPIDWPEPFGLVLIEAMACGTPVIAYRRGSVPELVEPGVTGDLVRDVDEAVAAVQALDPVDGAQVRARFERRFTADRMARDYVNVYRSLPGVRRTSGDGPPLLRAAGIARSGT